MAAQGQARPTHGECAYFAGGFCTLRGVPVEASAPACPEFVPRGAVYPPAPVPFRTPFPRFQAPVPLPTRPWGRGMGFGLGLGLRRRHRHRRRRRHGW